MATKDVSDPNKPISVTQPGTKLGKDFHNKRASLPPSKYNPRYQRNSFTELLGDSGGFSTIDQKRYQVLLHPDEKGTRHGFDLVLRERATGKIIVVEQKGQNATESKAQQQPDKWIQKVNEKTIKGDGNYARSTRQEVAASHAVDRAMHDGNLEYQLHRTHVDANGQMHTDVEKQVRIYEKGEPAQGGPVRSSVVSPGPDPKPIAGASIKLPETSPMSDPKRPVPKAGGNNASFKGFDLKPQPVNASGNPAISGRGDTAKPQTVSVPEQRGATFRGFGKEPGAQTGGPPSKQPTPGQQAAVVKPAAVAKPAHEHPATHAPAEGPVPTPKPAPTVPPPKRPAAGDKTVKSGEQKATEPRPADRNVSAGPPPKQTRQGMNPAPSPRAGDLKRVQANMQKISAAAKANEAPAQERGHANTRSQASSKDAGSGSRSSAKGGPSSPAGKGSAGGRSAGSSAPSRGGGGAGRGR